MTIKSTFPFNLKAETQVEENSGKEQQTLNTSIHYSPSLYISRVTAATHGLL